MWTSHARRHRTRPSIITPCVRALALARALAPAPASIFYVPVCIAIIWHYKFEINHVSRHHTYASIVLLLHFWYFWYFLHVSILLSVSKVVVLFQRQLVLCNSGTIYASILMYRSASSCRAFPTTTSSLQFW